MVKQRILRVAILFAVILVLISVASCGKERKAGETSVSALVSKTSMVSGTAKDGIIAANVSLGDPEVEPEINYTMTLFIDDPMTGTGEHPFERLVIAYNRAHPDQGIEVLGEKYPSMEEAETASTLMAMELAEGKGADILVLDAQRLALFSEKGYLLSLENSLSGLREELVSEIIEQGVINDCLMGVPPCISKISGFVVPSDLVGGKTWTVTDAVKIMELHPEFERTCVYSATYKTFTMLMNGREVSAAEYYEFEVINNMLMRNLLEEPFLNLNDRKADYYCEDLVRVFENIRKDQKAEITAIDADDPGKFLSEYFEIRNMTELVDLFSKYYGKYNFVGFPGTKNGGNKCDSYFFMAVNANSAEKEAATAFIDFAVSPEGQLAMGKGMFSVRKDAADVYIHPMERTNLDPVMGWGVVKSPADIKEGDVFDQRDYIRLGIFEDIDGFKSMYGDFICGLNGPGKIEPDPGLEEITYIITYELWEFLSSKDEDPNTAASRIQSKVQEYLDGLEY